MTKEDEGHYAWKHGQDREINPDLAEMIKKKALNGKLSCAAAFKIASDMYVEPAEVGFTLDSLEIKIAQCQLGIFGHSEGEKIVKPMEDVPDALEKAILEALTDGKLQCRNAWNTAERLGIRKIDVASACDNLGIKISSCQLGAF